MAVYSRLFARTAPTGSGAGPGTRLPPTGVAATTSSAAAPTQHAAGAAPITVHGRGAVAPAASGGRVTCRSTCRTASSIPAANHATNEGSHSSAPVPDSQPRPSTSSSQAGPHAASSRSGTASRRSVPSGGRTRRRPATHRGSSA